MFYNYEDFVKKAEDFFNEEDFGNAKLEYEKALRLADGQNKKDIKVKISEVCQKLSEKHVDIAENLISANSYEEAFDELVLALKLSSEENKKSIGKKLEEIKTLIKKENIVEKYEANLERGEEFIEKENIREAYVEFREAYNGLKKLNEKDELRKDIESKLKEIEHKLVTGYLKRAEDMIEKKEYEEAWKELEQAQAIVDDFDQEDVKEIEKLYSSIKKNLVSEELTGDRHLKEEILDRALSEFEESMENFFKYGLAEKNPYIPTYTNEYERKYHITRKNLAVIYEQIGDEFVQNGKNNIALKFYSDSLALLNEDEREYIEVAGKLDVVRKIKK
ncbi:MAG: hypothetical protein C0601_12155 [Candidatus Muiribacterium halophilum]|uniref:Tetratricopeptide repeat protein n=1 Tax=Muiribacterium halophilum TaxID=2053465 RepID=A0A2N5ZAM0_MUIH1|nr:MAG: hypothetical protein C0601_12155 [Candidatus Muirbacterium halophilum]